MRVIRGFLGSGKFISVWREEIHFDPLSLSPLGALGESSLPEGEGAARGMPNTLLLAMLKLIN